MHDALFIGAHPDDCELFAGGLIALLAQRGYSIAVLDLTRGEMSSRGTPEQREKEKQRANDIMGINARISLDLGDASLLETDDTMHQVVRALRRLRPKFVFLQYPEDRHPDHVKAARIAQQAIFYARLQHFPVREEPLFISGYAYYIGNTHSPHRPDFIVDITDTFDTQREALKAYETQFYNPDVSGYPTYISSEKFFSYVETRARYFGSLVGVEYGEPYILDRALKLDDPLDILLHQKFL